ncbi:hypothetical protein BDV37DRAFT_288579 [Aspergillus pseudonomiae]|uniref:MACPF domain-containing protein n=1 Tax=Aspergillus pseudonomiae TaxID=1506151 RepID=A0A5N7CVZ3_9EURO|nr:uncharacterized protein BDV37DRAFT_288579 [Aspergillus pseudonomiae]KAE8398376.1 hypothetical protein BDV37DRAFT_288579 [Aspergillus pseudonomiae]
MDKFVTLGSFKNVQGTRLKDIRAMLNSENGLSVRLQGSPFCNKVGAVANENLHFTEYIKSLDRGGTKSEEEKEEESDKQGYSTQVPGADQPVAESQAYAVYFKSRALTSEMNDVTKEFLKEKLELELRKAEISKVDKPDILTSSYDHASFMAGAGKGAVVHPTDMTQGQWNTVLETNALLHASYVRLLRKGTVCKVERAMYPAFQLRSRLFLDFNASKDDKDIVIPARHLFIPRFRVEDDSYVEVSENKSSVASAIASSSLSETAAEVAVGGGAFGYSAGAQAGFKAEEQGSESKATSEETRHMIITYNFPRVILQLDEESLELTEECANDLAHVTDMASITSFKARYGTFFATRVELGGRLHATEDSAALGKTSVSEKSKAMKAAASLSFSSPWVQASASASSASSSANKTESSESSLNVSMTWEAKGGDTLLCNNPPAWCSTVASFYNWRVVKQENLLSIEDIIAKIPGHEDVKNRFSRIIEGEKAKERAISEATIQVRFRETETGHYLALESQPSMAIANQIKLGGKGPGRVTWLKENMKEWRRVLLQSEKYIFKLHGKITTTDSKSRVLAGGAYTICDMDGTYLEGTPFGPLYPVSYMHEGAKETAWIFTMNPQNSLQETHSDLEPKASVQFRKKPPRAVR